MSDPGIVDHAYLMGLNRALELCQGHLSLLEKYWDNTDIMYGKQTTAKYLIDLIKDQIEETENEHEISIC